MRAASVRLGVFCIAAASAAAALFAGPATADHLPGTLRHVSTGPTDANGANRAWYHGVAKDAKKIIFVTGEPLVPEDQDGADCRYWPTQPVPHPCEDVYARENGVTTLISTSATNPNTSFDMDWWGGSSDGQRDFFTTDAQLTPDDLDHIRDIYERDGTTTRLVSTGTTGGNSESFTPDFAGSSGDGSHVFFTTLERLVPADTDGRTDVYDRSGGTTSLVSTGPGDTGTYHAEFGGNSVDGSRVFFETAEPLVLSDSDSGCFDYSGGPQRLCKDVYERSGGTTTLLSTSASAGNVSVDSQYEGTSDDGTRVFLRTSDKLQPQDVDGVPDIYVRTATSALRITTGPLGGNVPGALHGDFLGNSPDGTRAYFASTEQLVSADTDNPWVQDIYLRANSTTELVSIRPDGGNTNEHVSQYWGGATPDLQHIFFTTDEQLTNEDTGGLDLYEYSGGVSKLVSTGPSPSGDQRQATFGGVSDDGSRVFFRSAYGQLVAEDTDFEGDVYERSGGVTRVISHGPSSGNGNFGEYFRAASSDGKRVVFDTQEPMLPSDTDSQFDIYEVRSGHETPQAAASEQLSLVPELRQTISSTQCTARGGTSSTHGAPLSLASCNPPGYLPRTAAHMGPQAVGSAALTALPGNRTTPADEADVAMTASMVDVRALPGGGDYDPGAGADVTFIPRFRFTDTLSGATADDPATVSDFFFSMPVECTPSPGAEGSSCAVSSTADAVMPGAVLEGRSLVIQDFGARLRDSGDNAIRGDGDDRAFAIQGVYVP